MFKVAAVRCGSRTQHLDIHSDNTYYSSSTTTTPPWYYPDDDDDGGGRGTVASFFTVIPFCI